MEAQKSILIIDDDPEYVEGVTSILEKADYQVEAAYNPKDGLETLQSKPYDLLILDIMMGRGAEGVMLARKIRKDPVLRETPTIIITSIREQIAYLFPGQPLQPKFLPIDALMEKPVESDELLEQVSAMLQESEKRKAQSETE
jgi:CheY-like chemotaxis protein